MCCKPRYLHFRLVMLDTSVEHKFVGDRYHIFLRKGKCKVRAKRGQLGDRHVTRRSLHDSLSMIAATLISRFVEQTFCYALCFHPPTTPNKTDLRRAVRIQRRQLTPGELNRRSRARLKHAVFENGFAFLPECCLTPGCPYSRPNEIHIVAST